MWFLLKKIKTNNKKQIYYLHSTNDQRKNMCGNFRKRKPLKFLNLQHSVFLYSQNCISGFDPHSKIFLKITKIISFQDF